MTPFQREALLKSIYHWRKNLKKAKAGKKPDIYSDDCQCCKQFAAASVNSCPCCPIAEYVGESMCRGTPWIEVDRTQYPSEEREVFIRAIKTELKFLEEILINDGVNPKK